MGRWLVAGVLALAFVGCDAPNTDRASEPGSAGRQAPAPGPDYCPEGPGSPITGRVLVPDWTRQAAGDAKQRAEDDSRRELPAGDVSIRIYRYTDDETLAEATTDAKGRWCVRIGEDVGLGVDLLAEATFEGVSLRRSVVSRFAQVLSIRSEALIRLLTDEREVDLSEVSRAVYLNMESIASTAIDLVDPVKPTPGESLAAAIQRATDRLGDEGRLDKKLKRLGAGAEP